jgi:hypothetical protein
VIEAENSEAYEQLATVIRQTWGDEESELRQNIFASFVLTMEQSTKIGEESDL